MKNIDRMQTNILKMINRYVGKNTFIFYPLYIMIMMTIGIGMIGKIKLLKY